MYPTLYNMQLSCGPRGSCRFKILKKVGNSMNIKELFTERELELIVGRLDVELGWYQEDSQQVYSEEEYAALKKLKDILTSK